MEDIKLFFMKQKNKANTSQTSKTNLENEMNEMLNALDKSVESVVNLINGETERIKKDKIRFSDGKEAIYITFLLDEMDECIKQYGELLGDDFIQKHQKRLISIFKKIRDATIKYRFVCADKMTELKNSHLLYVCCIGKYKNYTSKYNKVEKAYLSLVYVMVKLVDDFRDTLIKVELW